MTPWLTLVIGVILGLLLGWLIDLLYRRRPGTASTATDTVAPARAVEWPVPQPTPAAEIVAGSDAPDDSPVLPEAEDALAEGLVAPVEPETPETPEIESLGVAVEGPLLAETRLPEVVLPAEPVATAELGEVERVDWPELSDRVAQVAGEIEELPAHIAAELPEVSERLSSDEIEVLAPVLGKGASASAKDDLLRIEGIGRIYNDRLRAAGISTFVQLGSANEARLQEIVQPQAWQRVNFADWIEQAKLIVEGNEEELRLLQERLFRRKKG